jgi:hypothetical protein
MEEILKLVEEYIKEKDKPRDGSLGKTKKSTGLKSKDYLHIETEDSGDKKKLFSNDILVIVFLLMIRSEI